MYIFQIYFNISLVGQGNQFSIVIGWLFRFRIHVSKYDLYFLVYFELVINSESFFINSHCKVLLSLPELFNVHVSSYIK